MQTDPQRITKGTFRSNPNQLGYAQELTQSKNGTEEFKVIWCNVRDIWLIGNE